MPETGVQLDPAFAAQLEKEIQEMKSILQISSPPFPIWRRRCRSADAPP